MSVSTVNWTSTTPCDEHGALLTTPQTFGLPTQKFLTTSGDGLGNINQNLNFAATPTNVYYQTATRYDLYSFLINIADNATFALTDYGGIAGGVTNGVTFSVFSAAANLTIPLLSGLAVNNNLEYYQAAAFNSLTTFAGPAQALNVLFRIREAYGMPLILSPGDKFIVTLNDDFTGLLSHTFHIRGIKYPT